MGKTPRTTHARGKANYLLYFIGIVFQEIAIHIFKTFDNPADSEARITLQILQYNYNNYFGNLEHFGL